ncbi:MAG: hypothetical protein AB1813_06730 [Verrucomicrobiota bacterium]
MIQPENGSAVGRCLGSVEFQVVTKHLEDIPQDDRYLRFGRNIDDIYDDRCWNAIDPSAFERAVGPGSALHFESDMKFQARIDILRGERGGRHWDR